MHYLTSFPGNALLLSASKISSTRHLCVYKIAFDENVFSNFVHMYVNCQYYSCRFPKKLCYIQPLQVTRYQDHLMPMRSSSALTELVLISPQSAPAIYSLRHSRMLRELYTNNAFKYETSKDSTGAWQASPGQSSRTGHWIDRLLAACANLVNKRCLRFERDR